ncbi:MAG TPA: molybdopterin-binding protein [Anaerolineae bacterium]|nr:molybdopterin-binding protein [Anaerolineae bacterium]
MKFGPVPLEEAEGKILGHNIAGRDGRRVLRKGKALTRESLAALREIGRSAVYVAEMEPGDVGEDLAARRIAAAVIGSGLRPIGPASGRVNLLAEVQGVLRVDARRLAALNAYEGITLATLPAHSAVRPRQIVATIKIIPFAVAETVLRAAEAIGVEPVPLVRVDQLQPQPVNLIFSGSSSIRDKLAADFAPLRERVEALGSIIAGSDYVSLEDESGEATLADLLQRRQAAGARLIVVAGETAIMDRRDIVPRAIERAGGQVECFGAPVDPGNLLMLAYLGETPILGAPGCARSRKVNVVDWVLPRLLIGDRLTREEIVALGHGGLLEDAPERPMPRSKLT